MGPYNGHPEDAFCSLHAFLQKNGHPMGVSIGIFPHEYCEGASIDSFQLSVYGTQTLMTLEAHGLSGETKVKFRRYDSADTISIAADYVWPKSNGGEDIAVTTTSLTPGRWWVSIGLSQEVLVEIPGRLLFFPQLVRLAVS